jgi:hypothetical protein
MGSGRRTTWSTSVKIAVFAPMPNAIESTASVVNSGARRSVRNAKRTSAITRLI